MKKLLNALKYLLFLAIGLVVFYYIYREIELETLAEQISSIRWRWIVLSLAIGLQCHICRALRWDMLIESAGYTAGRFRTFCAVMAMYFTNLIIPRGGEIVRCTTLARTDSVPFAVLLGTVVVERTVDMILMIVIAAVLFIFQIDQIKFDSVLVDFYVARKAAAQQIEITPDKFGGNFYLEASTLFRNESGVDMPAEFIIPNCKIQSNFTFTMYAK